MLHRNDFQKDVGVDIMVMQEWGMMGPSQLLINLLLDLGLAVFMCMKNLIKSIYILALLLPGPLCGSLPPSL